jgi:integrase
MAKVLTQAGIDALLRNPPTARRETPDGKTKRLYFVDQLSGSASWAWRYSFAGKPEKLTFTPYPDIGLAKARALAANAAAVLADGRRPAAEKQAALVAAKAALEAAPLDLFDDVAELYVERGLKKKREQKRERTKREIARIIAGYLLPKWRGRRFSSIAKAEGLALVDAMVERTPVMANRTLATMKALGRFAVSRDIITVNPFATIERPAPETSRDRALSDLEIGALLKAVDAESYPYGPVTRLLLMLGARRSEVAEMRWSEIDLATKTWTLPAARSKNRHEHVLPLPDAAVDILRGLPRIEGSDLVFTSDGRPLGAFDWTKKRLHARMEAALGQSVPPWTFHDLRRTCASGLAAIGVAPHVIERVLNYRGGEIRGIGLTYNRHPYAAEMLSALTAWSRRLGEIEHGAVAANVIAFPRS